MPPPNTHITTQLPRCYETLKLPPFHSSRSCFLRIAFSFFLATLIKRTPLRAKAPLANSLSHCKTTFTTPYTRDTMPRRRGSTRRDTSTPSNRRVARGGIRKNTRSRQAPSRYGQPPTQTNQQPRRENTSGTSSESGDKEPSDSEYRH